MIAKSKNFLKNNKLALSFSLIGFINLVVILFVNIHNQKVEFWDEGTNAQVVYEIEKSIPNLTLFSENFFEKPPLWYFATALFVKAFGFNELSIRIVSILSALMVGVIIYYVLYKKYNLYSAAFGLFELTSIGHLFLNSSTYFSTHSFRSADLDALHILFILLSFLFFWNYYEKFFVITNLTFSKVKLVNYLFEKDLINIIIGSVFALLAVLTKGPLGFLPIIVFVIYKLIYDRSSIKIISIIIVLLIFIVLLPWHLMMFVLHGSIFVEEYVLYTIFQRSITAIESHTQPAFYYFRLLIDPYFCSITAIYFVSLFFSIKQKLYRSFFHFSVSLTPILILILFTTVQTKLAWYILPIYPFLIIQTIGLFQVKMHKKIKYFFVLLLFICVVMGNLIVYKEILKLNSDNENTKIFSEAGRYLYTEEINRSDLFYLNKFDLSYTNIDNQTQNGFYLVNNSEISTIMNELSSVKIIKSNNSYTIIQIE